MKSNGHNNNAGEATESPQQLSANPARDIICGRGLHIMSHLGNMKLHRAVNRYRDTYHKALRQDKPVIAKRIVEEMKSSGSRFIRRVEGGREDEWEEVDNQTAYKKVGHALRLRKNPLASKAKVMSGTTQGVSQNHDSMVGSSAGTMSTALHRVAGTSSTVPQIRMVQDTSVLPSLFLNAPWHPLDGSQFQAVGLLASQPIRQLQLHSPVVPSIADRHGQLLMNSLFANNVFNPTLSSMVYSPGQQQGSLFLQLAQILSSGGAQGQSFGPQLFSSTSDEMG